MSDKRPVRMTKTEIVAMMAGIQQSNVPASDIIRALAYLLDLRARYVASRRGQASRIDSGRPPREAIDDSDRLFLCINTEPEFDQHDNMAGAAIAVIERLRGVMAERINEARASAGLLAHSLLARQNIAKAIRRPELETWVEIEDTIQELVQQRDALAKQKLDGGCGADAVPVLAIGDVNAMGVLVEFTEPDDWSIERGHTVIVAGYHYVVTDWETRTPLWETPTRGRERDTLRLQPLDGAPVIPTGEGLTIAREIDRAPEDWTPDPFLAPLISAIAGERDEDDPDHPVHAAIAVIERLKGERARHEQRRLDLAKKMGLGPGISEWNHIAVHAERYGLLSEPVRRFALAMQERLDACALATWKECPHDGLMERLRARTAALSNALVDPFSLAGLYHGTVRRTAAEVAAWALFVADNEGDLDTFDAVAEIAAARGKSAD